MVQAKKDIYRKAYYELNEIFNSALSFEIDRIPSQVMENMKNQMDTDYNWSYDYSKNLMDQDMMSETKALLVEIYARYLSSEEEKKEWEKYNSLCVEMIEEERIRQNDPSNIFYNPKDNVSEENSEISKAYEKLEFSKDTENTNKNSMVEASEESFIVKLLNSIKDSLNNIFKNKKIENEK